MEVKHSITSIVFLEAVQVIDLGINIYLSFSEVRTQYITSVKDRRKSNDIRIYPEREVRVGGSKWKHLYKLNICATGKSREKAKAITQAMRTR